MLESFWRAVDRCIIAVGGVIVLIAVLHVCFDVVGKYFFGVPVAGTIIYVSNYYMPMMVFLPLVVAEYRNQHIAVDLMPSRIPRGLDLFLRRFTWLLSAFVFGLLTYSSLIDANRKFNEGEFALDQSGRVFTWPSYYVLPIGFVLVTALLIAKFLRPEVRGPKTELPEDV
jgi:TRAP-type C4-dicarboxylate transport system permease small subunit